MKLSFKGLLCAVLISSGGAAVPTAWAADTLTNAPAAVANQTGGNAVDGAETRARSTALTFGLDAIPGMKREFPQGIPLYQYAASFIYILLAFAVSKALSFLSRIYLKKFTERTKTRFDDMLLAILNGPIRIVCFVVLLHIGLRVFDWPDVIEDFLAKALKVIVAVSITYMVLKVIDLVLNYWKRRSAHETEKTFDDQLFPLIRRTVQAFIIVVACLLTSHNLGLNITSLIASLSIGGLALGLAAQDTLGNLFGAVSVFVDKPFRLGDRVQLSDLDGVVEEIGLRSTRIRNLDGHLITVPNKTMGSSIITNVTRRPNIKTVMNIGITYDTPTEKVRQALQILEDVYKKHPKTFDVQISFNQFADSALNIMVVHWWNSTDHKEYLQGIQEMNLTVKQRFDEAGINFAFPSRTLYLKQDSEWRLTGDILNGKPVDQTAPRA